MLSRSIETDVFQLPQLHKHFNVARNYKLTSYMKQLFVLFFSTLTFISNAQFDKHIWDNLDTIKTDSYQLQVPSGWRHLPSLGGQGPEQFFEASGVAFPRMYNGAPVMVTIFVVKQDGKDLEECKDECFKGYRENDDRQFPKDFQDGQEKIQLTSGQQAYFLNTHFYRKSKGLNQSRFDLVVYSDNAKTGYLYTISIQYSDDKYKFENDNDLTGFSKKLFSYFKII